MKDTLTYIVETVVCSGVFVLLYRLLFSARVSYGFSRAYLIVSTIAAAVIPLLAIPVYPARVIQIAVPMVATSTAALEAGTVPPTMQEFDWGVAALVLYLVMAAAAFVMLICQMVRIKSYKRDAEHTVEHDIDIYTSPRIRSSFSFLKSIFLVFGLAPDERCEIVAHERSHIRHHHTADMIAMSILRAVLWFNPFVWISYRYLVEVHEYEADRDLLDAGHEITLYRKLILKQLLGYNPEITSGFANSLTKKRFIMMTKKKSKYAPLRYAAIVPVAAGMMMLFSFTRADDRHVPSVAESTEQTPVQNNSVSIELPDEKPLLNAEVMPKFQNGDLNAFGTWVSDNIKYPDGKPSGRVVVEFIIERDGTLTNINTLLSSDPKLQAAVEAVLKKSPQWTPGRQKDEAVRVKFIMPVKFETPAAQSQKELTISSSDAPKTVGDYMKEHGLNADSTEPAIEIGITHGERKVIIYPGTPFFDEGLKEPFAGIIFNGKKSITLVVSGETEYGKRVLKSVSKEMSAVAKANSK